MVSVREDTSTIHATQRLDTQTILLGDAVNIGCPGSKGDDMNHDVVIRRAEERDEEKVNELLATVFLHWKGRDYFRWKYRENPAGSAHIWLAEVGGRVAASRAVNPVMVKVDDGIILGGQGLDTVTHPDYQRRGLFASLTRMQLTGAVKDGTQIVYSFPSSRTYRALIKAGWHDLGPIPSRLRLLKVGSALKVGMSPDSLVEPKPRNLNAALKLLWKALRRQNMTTEENSYLGAIRYTLSLLAVLLSNPRGLFRPGKTRQVPGLVIKQVDSFDERITSFWREIAPRFPIAVDRNSEYLNWKYQRNPVDRYLIFIAENRGQIEGYMVLKSEGDEGIIMDIISRGNQVFACLLDKALRHFTDEGKVIVECWMSGSFSYSQVLRRFGFGSYQWLARWASHVRFLQGWFNPFGLYIINSALAEKRQQKLRRPDSWFLAAGDSDWF